MASGYLFVAYILEQEMAIGTAYMLTCVLIKVPPGYLFVAVKLKQVQSQWEQYSENKTNRKNCAQDKLLPKPMITNVEASTDKTTTNKQTNKTDTPS